MSGPDPKPGKRVRDKSVTRRAHLTFNECSACERSDVPLNVHHVLYGAHGRTDDPRNLLPLCGSGTTGCHGKFHDADPETIRRVGAAIADRPEIIAFVLEHLGAVRGKGYLSRRYRIAL